MKKIGKKINNLVKVFMAVGLLFTNIMPFSTVLAEELTDSNNQIIAGESNASEEEIENKLDGENANDEVTLGEDSKEEETPGENVTPDENNEGTGEDGETPSTDEPTTQTDDEVPGDIPATEVSFAYEVYVDDVKYEDDYGFVELDKSAGKLEIIARLSGAETTDNYTFVIGSDNYTTESLLNGVVVTSITFPGYLYGPFDLEVDGILTNPEGTDEEEWMHYVVEYGTDADNDEALSAVNSDYVFSESKLITTKYDEETLRNIVNEAFPNAFIDTLNEEELILGDDHGMYAWYGIVTKGDVNSDGKIDKEDLELLINQVLGLEEPNENSDVNGDGAVDELDATYLKLMLETGNTEDITQDDVTIDSKFGEFSGPVKVGDEFTLEYIVTLSDYTINGISGLVNYDKNLLELVSAESNEFNLGNMNADKFLYFGEYLDLDIDVEYDEEGNVVLDEDGMPKLIINDVDYVLVKLTFKALAAGTATVSVDGVKYFDWSYYYTANGVTSIDVVIEEDSPFTSIKVSDYEVDLSNFTVTVPNDVTNVDVTYALVSDDYSVTTIVAPEELAVGANTITITVTAPDGSEKTYTITVTREGKEENSSNVTPMNYSEDNSYDEGNKDDTPEVTPVPDNDGDKEVEPDSEETKGNNVSRIIIIILILLAIAGLIYLIFKDEDDEETKKANKDIDKFKHEEEKPTKKVDNNKNHNNKNHNNKNSNKKGR